jgi:hypothetical protein
MSRFQEIPMFQRTWQLGVSLLALALFTACGGGSSSNPDVQITIQARFEKRPLTPTGFGATVTRPARYCRAEVREASSSALLASGYLGSDGTGVATVPTGTSAYVQVFAEYQVPSADPNASFFEGSVRNEPLPGSFASTDAFLAVPTWSVTSDVIQANQDGTLTVTALASNRIAGAFNIADQAVSFGAAVRDMDGSTTLRLPSLHTFWTISTHDADQSRSYPALAQGPGSTILVSNHRALFTHSVYGNGSGAANTEADEWDDGVLQETFARLLFADGSYQADGSSALSLLRRDNDNVWVDRTVQSESTAAFVAGFSDFLSAAVRNDSRILDSYADATGVFRVDAFDLTDHAFVPSAAKGEFSRGSIAIGLWGLWKNVLGGSGTGLNTLWAAVRSTTAYPDGTGEFEQGTLGCFPTYLQGVASRVSTTTWTAALTELAREQVPNPDTFYFQGNALWLTRPVGFSEAGSLQTYAAATGLYYDRNQSQAYRFTHSGGARTITMTPTSGQDFYLELIGPGGWVAGSTGSDLLGQTRTLTVTNLPAGVYVARVRAGATTSTGMNTFNISVN